MLTRMLTRILPIIAQEMLLKPSESLNRHQENIREVSALVSIVH